MTHVVADVELRDFLAWLLHNPIFGTAYQVAEAYAAETGLPLECALVRLRLAEALGFIVQDGE